MYSFKTETDLQKFDKFVCDNKGSYLQYSKWSNVKTTWNPYFYSATADGGEGLVATALVLERKIPAIGKVWYISCGLVCSEELKADADYITEFVKFIKVEMKKHGAFSLVIDPLVPIRIEGELMQSGVAVADQMVANGFVLNQDIDSYTYKHPVQTMIPLKDENGEEIPAEKILKGCEKGVRYSVRVGGSRGLVSARYKYADILADPSIMEDFMSVLSDTSDRNSFIGRDGDYCLNLMKNLEEYTDITIVYYDKALDKKLEDERQARKQAILSELPTAPQKKLRGLQDELDVIEKNTASYDQRRQETSDSEDDARVAVAGGLTIRFGGVASCIFGGSRNLLRNNTRSSHYLNYLRMSESVDENMDYHDLGYVLVGNPTPWDKNYIPPVEPLENFVGICDFKKSFGAQYFEYIGEYVLTISKPRAWLYRELLPKAKHTMVKIKQTIKK